MRTHKLRDTAILGTGAICHAHHDFSLYNLTEVIRLVVKRNETETTDVTLSCLYSLGEAGVITLVFKDVKKLVPPEFQPRAFVSEIELEDVSLDGLEGIKFIFKDFGGSGLEIHSMSVEVVRFCRDSQ